MYIQNHSLLHRPTPVAIGNSVAQGAFVASVVSGSCIVSVALRTQVALAIYVAFSNTHNPVAIGVLVANMYFIIFICVNYYIYNFYDWQNYHGSYLKRWYG